jgi:hypothetical protein
VAANPVRDYLGLPLTVDWLYVAAPETMTWGAMLFQLAQRTPDEIRRAVAVDLLRRFDALSHRSPW